MHTSLRFLAISGLVLATQACGSKGKGSPDDMGSNDGSGGSSSTDTTGTSNGTGGESTSTETSGTGGSAGGPVEAELQYGFDEDLEGWDVLYASSEPDVDLITLSDVDVEWTEDEGNPGGALKTTVPYEEGGQYVGFGLDLTGMALDLTGHTITADIQLVSGAGDADDLGNTAGAKIYVKTTEMLYVYASGNYENVLEHGTWYTLEFDLEYPDYVDTANGMFDPSDILEVGIQFDCLSTTSSAQEAVWLIDNVSW